MRQIATIPPIVAQHAEDAAFLWSRRRREIDGQILGDADIGRIDLRLDGNIEGLFASGKAGWDVALARFSDYPEQGELFVMAVLALQDGGNEPMGVALDAAASLGDQGVRAFSGAIARSSRDTLSSFVARWLDSTEPLLRNLGLRALWHHRTDPGSRLKDLISHVDGGVRIMALRLAGAMKRVDVAGAVVGALTAKSRDQQLAAAYAACMLGEAQHARPVLDRLLRSEGGLAAPAFEMRLLVTPGTSGRTWLRDRLNEPSLRTLALSCIGMTGDRTIMPWLINKMQEPDLAYSAGVALRDLLEIDFNDTDVFTIDPPSIGKPFAKVEESPLPVAEKVEAWWANGHGMARHEPFLSMRRLKLDAYRAALAEPRARLSNWRHTRAFPAWM